MLSVHPWPALVCALLLTMTVAFVIGIPVLKLKGHYLAMATLGFGTIIYSIVLGTARLGAADGISDVPPFPLLPGLGVGGSMGGRIVNYYIAWGILAAVMLLLLNLIHSRVGRALRAIHGDEDAASAMGVDTARYKLRTFVLSAALAALAGVLLTHFNGGIGPSEASIMKSVRYVAIVAVGGMGSLWGTLQHEPGAELPLAARLLRDVRRRRVRRHPDRHHALRARGHPGDRPAPGPPRLLRPDPGRTGGAPLMPLLQVSSLSKSFGGLHAVSNVSFDVAKGMIKAVIGPNGAGKTTLFNLVSGFLLPDAGEVRFDGRPIRGVQPCAGRGHRHLPHLPEHQALPGMTALENVMVGRHVRSRSGFLAGMLHLPSHLARGGRDPRNGRSS